MGIENLIPAVIGGGMALGEIGIREWLTYYRVSKLGNLEEPVQITPEDLNDTAEQVTQDRQLAEKVRGKITIAALGILTYSLVTDQDGMATGAGAYLFIKAIDWLHPLELFPKHPRRRRK